MLLDTFIMRDSVRYLIMYDVILLYHLSNTLSGIRQAKSKTTTIFITLSFTSLPTAAAATTSIHRCAAKLFATTSGSFAAKCSFAAG